MSGRGKQQLVSEQNLPAANTLVYFAAPPFSRGVPSEWNAGFEWQVGEVSEQHDVRAEAVYKDLVEPLWSIHKT